MIIFIIMYFIRNKATFVLIGIIFLTICCTRKSTIPKDNLAIKIVSDSLFNINPNWSNATNIFLGKQYILLNHIDIGCAACFGKLFKWYELTKKSPRLLKAETIFIAHGDENDIQIFSENIKRFNYLTFPVFFDKERKLIDEEINSVLIENETVLLINLKIAFIGSPLTDEKSFRHLLKLF